MISAISSSDCFAKLKKAIFFGKKMVSACVLFHWNRTEKRVSTGIFQWTKPFVTFLFFLSHLHEVRWRNTSNALECYCEVAAWIKTQVCGNGFDGKMGWLIGIIKDAARFSPRSVMLAMIVGTAAMLLANMTNLPGDAVYYGLATSLLIMLLVKRKS